MKCINVGLLVLALSTAAWGFEPSRCKGGDGPTPFVEIPHSYFTGQLVIPTQGLVKDFLYWDKKASLVYRNESNEVHVLDVSTTLASSGGGDQLLETNAAALQRVPDPDERHIVTSDSTSVNIFDAQTQTSQSFALPSPSFQFLYWASGELFGFVPKFQHDSLMHAEIYGDTGALVSNSCYPETNYPGERFGLAQGSSYPYIYLYGVRPDDANDGGVLLSLHRLRIDAPNSGSASSRNPLACSLEPVMEYGDPIQGDIQEVFFYDQFNSFAVYTTDATSNLIWNTPDQCSYYNIGDRVPMVPNFHQPILVTSRHGDTRDGIQILYPNTGMKAKILRSETQFADINPENLWLTDEGDKLFVAAKPKGQTDRMLLGVKLDSNSFINR